MRWASSPTWRRTLGRQDHTTSPSAKSPLVSQHLRVHRIPHHVCDARDTPLIGAECEKQTSYSEKAKAKYLFAPILNATTTLMRFTKFDFSRTRCPIAF